MGCDEAGVGRPPAQALCVVFRWNPKGDAAIQRHHVKLDVEAFAVAVRPCTADAGPDGILAFPFQDVESVMGWAFA